MRPVHKSGFAVVIPMYNEEAGAAECVKKVCGVLDGVDCPSALIVVNDGSKDKTGVVLEGLARGYKRLKLVTHERNKGYGEALKTGVNRAASGGYEYVLFMDSDLTNDPGDIPKFVQKMEEGFDVIKASRYRGSGRMEGVPLRRALISMAGNKIASILFNVGVRDCTNGFRAVKTAILTQMDLTEPGFPVIMQEFYNLKFLAKSFCEVPVVLTSRKADQRATSFSYRPVTFIKYLKFAIKAFLGIRPRLAKT